MMLPKIIIEPDGLHCRADKELISAIAEILKYEKTVRKPNQFGTKIVRKDAYFIDRRTGRFLRGLLPRVSHQLLAKRSGHEVNMNGALDSPPLPLRPPNLKGIKLRDDQLRLVKRANDRRNGIIVSPTGSGKTIIALGLISSWPNARSLILVHRRDIVTQFAERARTYLPHLETQVIEPGPRIPLTGQLVCSTIQAIVKYPIKEVLDYFDITICDECHHVCDRKGMYGQFMLRNLSPIKIGFTATLPTGREKLLSLEGLLGPVIGELTLEDGQTMGIIAKPYVTLVPVPYDTSIGEHRKYRDIYNHGIAQNRARNARIIKLAKDRAAKGKTSLIIITELRQGDLLIEIAKKLNLNALFVQGKTKKDDREQIKDALLSGKVDSVICTDVWKEGIDIPTVGAVILAGGGKSSLALLQGVGRGMRTSEGKNSVELIDFLDPYRYLAEHAIRRIAVYAEKGWL